MKVVFVASSKMEAEIVRGKLEAHEIPARTFQDDEGGVMGALHMTSGVKVVVDDEDFEAAVAILAD